MDIEKRADNSAYKIVDVNQTNIDEYDVFCLKSEKSSEGYKNKVKWVKERFKEGLRFKLLLSKEGPERAFTSRGFIEYIPGEYAWRGIDAKGYMTIHCILVDSKYRNLGYGSKLLEHCLSDAKEMNGVAVVASEKFGWLPGRELFMKNGFEKVDAMPPHFELLAKRFSASVPLPKFNSIPKERLKKYASGITVFKSDQCPYLSDAVNTFVKIARQVSLPVRIEHIESREEAQSGVHPYGTFCVLLDGKALTYITIDEKELFKCLCAQLRI